MKNIATTYILYFYTELLKIFEKESQVKFTVPKIARGSKITGIVNNQGLHSDTTSFFMTKKGKELFVKSCNYTHKNSVYFRLKNEAKVLHLLSSLTRGTKNGLSIGFPRVIGIKKSRNNISLVTESIQGNLLKKYSEKMKSQVLGQVLSELNQLSTNKNIQKAKTVLPIRTKPYIFFTFFINLCIVIGRDLGSAKIYLQHGILFVRYYLTNNIFNPKLVIAHRDLHTSNIILKGSKNFVIDPEVMVIAEEHTDLAIMAKGISGDLKKEYVEFFKNKLLTNTDKKQFVALSIYYAFQIMAIRKKSNPDYKEGKHFLLVDLKKLQTNFEYRKKGVGENGLSVAINLFSFLRNLTGRKNYIKQNLIICYHNVGHDQWQFTTHPDLFEKQISWIANYAKIVSLNDIVIKTKKSVVSITFDDGYVGIKNTLALLNRFKIRPTLFVIGNTKFANRKELDNTLELLTVKELKDLIKKGWEIGYHSDTHSDLTRMNNSSLEKELVTSKYSLEKKLGIKIDKFAYPKGSYNSNVVGMLKKSGYSKAFTTDSGFVKDSKDLFHINRICFYGDIAQYQFEFLLLPFGIMLYNVYQKALITKERIVKNIFVRNTILKIEPKLR